MCIVQRGGGKAEQNFFFLVCGLMVIRVVEFSSGGYKNGKNQHTQRKVLNFENWCSGEVSKFDFQSQFSISKIIRIFLNFFFH